MKKLLALILTVVMGISFAACGNKEPDVPAEPADLVGDWVQVNSNSTDSYHIAVITDNEIEIYWYSEADETKSLYWAGSFTAPTTADEPYTWESANNTEKTEMALLASSDPSKTFTYEDGQIKYEASALGTTQTIKLEKK